MPSIPMMYTFDPQTRVHTGSRPAQVVGGKPLTQSAYATATPPPDVITEGKVARWTGTQWELVEDHRQHLDSTGTKQGGTPFWLAGEDDWQSPPRYTEDLGPLPAGAMTTRPEKPLSVVREEKEHEIRGEYWGGFTRHNTLFRRVLGMDGAELGEEFITENHAIMMYNPMLEETAP